MSFGRRILDIIETCKPGQLNQLSDRLCDDVRPNLNTQMKIMEEQQQTQIEDSGARSSVFFTFAERKEV